MHEQGQHRGLQDNALGDGDFAVGAAFGQDKESVLHPHEDYSDSLDAKRGTKPPLCGRFAQSRSESTVESTDIIRIELIRIELFLRKMEKLIASVKFIL